jgi:hypothetical protein
VIIFIPQIFFNSRSITIPDMQTNYLAVLIATVAGFFLSFIWYSALFGKAWAKEVGFDPNEKPPADYLALLLLAAFIIVSMR